MAGGVFQVHDVEILQKLEQDLKFVKMAINVSVGNYIHFLKVKFVNFIIHKSIFVLPFPLRYMISLIS